MKKQGQASIFEARLWMTDNFDASFLKSKLGYTDGTGGEADVPTSIRPSGFGAATFTFQIIDGKPVVTDIAGIAGEVPGEQTVPRAEVWAATVLLSRAHPNAVVRIGIDAAYVVDGVWKRDRLGKRKTGTSGPCFLRFSTYAPPK